MEYDLVFEGGGAKGMVFVGAMDAFIEAGQTTGRLLGTSAGAITATLLAAGYSREEMLQALAEKKDGKPVFAGFMGSPGPFDNAQIESSATLEFLRAVDLPLVPERIESKIDTALVRLLAKSEKYRHLFSFVELGGWYTARQFRHWMHAKLNAGDINGKARDFGDMTLREFYEATNNELCLVASDTTGQQPLILNHRTAPDCPIVWAVRMSMSIPLLWQEVEWQKEWGLYRGENIEEHVIVDGGVLSNFPLELLVSSAPHVTAVMGEKSSENVIGLLIDERLPVPGAPPIADESPRFDLGKLKTISRLKNLVDTMTNAHDKQIIESLSDLVVRLPAQGYGTTEFDMSEERQAALVSCGKKTMEGYLSERVSSAAKGFDLAQLERAERIATRIATNILGSDKT